MTYEASVPPRLARASASAIVKRLGVEDHTFVPGRSSLSGKSAQVKRSAAIGVSSVLLLPTEQTVLYEGVGDETSCMRRGAVDDGHHEQLLQ
eukprot:2939278-Amphidinium_carterae.1